MARGKEIPLDLTAAEFAVVKSFVADKPNFCRLSRDRYDAGAECMIARWGPGDDEWAVVLADRWVDFVRFTTFTVRDYRAHRLGLDYRADEEGMMGQLVLAHVEKLADGERHLGRKYVVKKGEREVWYSGNRDKCVGVMEYINNGEGGEA